MRGRAGSVSGLTFCFLPTHYLLVLALFFKSRDNLIAQKLGPHIVQYSPSI